MSQINRNPNAEHIHHEQSQSRLSGLGLQKVTL